MPDYSHHRLWNYDIKINKPLASYNIEKHWVLPAHVCSSERLWDAVFKMCQINHLNSSEYCGVACKYYSKYIYMVTYHHFPNGIKSNQHYFDISGLNTRVWFLSETSEQTIIHEDWMSENVRWTFMRLFVFRVRVSLSDTHTDFMSSSSVKITSRISHFSPQSLSLSVFDTFPAYLSKNKKSCTVGIPACETGEHWALGSSFRQH